MLSATAPVDRSRYCLNLKSPGTMWQRIICNVRYIGYVTSPCVAAVRDGTTCDASGSAPNLGIHMCRRGLVVKSRLSSRAYCPVGTRSLTVSRGSEGTRRISCWKRVPAARSAALSLRSTDSNQGFNLRLTHQHSIWDLSGVGCVLSVKDGNSLRFAGNHRQKPWTRGSLGSEM